MQHNRLIGDSKLPVGVNVCDELAICPGYIPPLAQIILFSLFILNSFINACIIRLLRCSVTLWFHTKRPQQADRPMGTVRCPYVNPHLNKQLFLSECTVREREREGEGGSGREL